MKTTVYCKTTEKGMHSFYLIADKSEYFLFCQSYRKGVEEYFKNGVSLDCAIDFTKSGYDSSVKKTMAKLPVYIKYIEKLYKIEIFSGKRKSNAKKPVRKKCSSYYEDYAGCSHEYCGSDIA